MWPVSIKRESHYFFCQLAIRYRISPADGVLFREPNRATRRPAIADRRRMVPNIQHAIQSGERAKQRRHLRL